MSGQDAQVAAPDLASDGVTRGGAADSRMPGIRVFRVFALLTGLAAVCASLIPWRDLVTAPVPARLMQPEQRHAWKVSLPQVGVSAFADLETSSPLTFRENGVPLHGLALQPDIPPVGGGWFRHWHGDLFFATPDYSDPRTNGRHYTIHQTRTLASLDGRFHMPAATFRALRLCGGCVLLILAVSPATGLSRHWLRMRTLPTLVMILLLLAIGLGLRANVVDVTTWGSKILHLALFMLLAAVFLANPFLAWRSLRSPALQGFGRASRHYSFVATSLVNVVALLLGLECLARVFPARDSFAYNPGSHFFWPDWYEPRNSLGYPDREPGEKRGPRVLLLGDSYTEGAGVPRPERFSNQLQGTWQRSCPALEVFAGARCGFDTIDEADVLEKTGDRIKPDLVVVCYVLNDAERDGQAATKRTPALESFLIEECHSYLYYWVHVMRRLAAGRAYGDGLRAQHRPDSLGWGHVCRGLDRISRWCDERHVRKELVVFPIFHDDAEVYRGVINQVVSAAQAHGFAAHSLLDVYPGPWSDLEVSPFDSHPNARAHAITARQMAEWITVPEESFQHRRMKD